CGVAIAISSAAGYALHAPPGALPQHAFGYVYLPAALGVAMASVLAAPLGTRLAHAIRGQALRKVFALFLLLVGVSVALSGCAAISRHRRRGPCPRRGAPVRRPAPGVRWASARGRRAGSRSGGRTVARRPLPAAGARTGPAPRCRWRPAPCPDGAAARAA